MLLPTIIMGTLALVFLSVGIYRGEGEHVEGLRSALRMIVQVLPLILCAFFIAGMVQALIPRESIARWVGAESGLRGILIGSLAGGLAPGGPMVSLPIVAGLLTHGAGVGTLVAFLTGWSLYGFNRLPMEFGILGWKMTLIRFACVAVFPPLAGLIAQALFGKVKLGGGGLSP
jgi:uncharacterized membrane protein YraQ (UPF0718 family)